MTNLTLPYSAKKKCIILMGARQVAVSSACLCPHTKTVRVITVQDIVRCLGAGARISEIINDKRDTKELNVKNAAYIFSDEHLEYLRRFNANIKTPVEKRESYLIDTPKELDKVEVKKAEEKSVEPVAPEVTVEEPTTADVVVSLTIEDTAEPVDEVEVEETIVETTAVEVEEEPTSTEESPEEEITTEEDTDTEEETPKYNNKYNNNNRKNKYRK